MCAYTVGSYAKLIKNSARAGRDISRKDDAVSEVIQVIKGEMASLQQLKNRRRETSELSDEEYRSELDALRARREQLAQRLSDSKYSAIECALDRLAEDFESRSFHWGLELGNEYDSRQTYKIVDDFYRHITAKQVERVLSRASHRYQPSRQSIVVGLRHVLAKPYNFGVIRTDIEGFFDSIQHDKLLECLSESDQIDSVSRHLIEQLLIEKEQLTGRPTGIPQGVGISSKLADVLLIDLDKAMVTNSKVEYYARFVDDMVIVVQSSEDIDAVEQDLSQHLLNLGLTLNPSKTQRVTADPKGSFLPDDASLTYLGYEYRKEKKEVRTRLTDERLGRLKARLEKPFELWQQHQKKCENSSSCSADGLLIQRIRFLTSNVRLHNSKGRVLVGIYYSNCGLTEFDQLLELDSMLDEFKSCLPRRLKEKLVPCSFEKGFKERTFSWYSSAETERITNCWKGMQ